MIAKLLQLACNDNSVQGYHIQKAVCLACRMHSTQKAPSCWLEWGALMDAFMTPA